MYKFHRINCSFKLCAVDKKIELSEETSQKIDRIWSKAIELNPQLFDGKCLVLDSFDQNIASVYEVSYRYFYAGYCNDEIRKILSLRFLAVTGFCLFNAKIIIGKRGKNVSQFPGKWEFVPSGGVSEIDFQSQLLQELEEELGIPCEHVKQVENYGILEDSTVGVFDILLTIELANVIHLKKSPEVDEIKMLSYDELYNSLTQSSAEWLSSCRYLLSENLFPFP